MTILSMQRACITILLAGLAIGGATLLPAAGEQLEARPNRLKTPPASNFKTRERPIQVDVNVVLVNVTVTDPLNRLVTGLEKEHFHIFEDQSEQKILHFSNEDVPISLGLVVDTSGSMSNKLDKARMAVLQFFKTASPQDEFFIVDFNDQPRLVCDFTASMEQIQNKLADSQAGGHTALLDAVYVAIQQMQHARRQKKALLILSDGGENHSRYTRSEIKSLVKEADVQIYAIGLFNARSLRPTPEEMSGPILLTDLAETTGGRLFPISNLKELSEMAEKIGIELRNQYILGYVPNNSAKDGKWRKIKVKLTPPPGLAARRVYARSGYYAPSQ